MSRYPVAYLRRSTADADSTGDVSRAVQESAVLGLAERDNFAPDDVRMFVDWARSADEEKSEKRTEYAAMLRLIEAGEVCCVYAYALDRLNRSLVMSAQFAKACEANDVRIVTQREGEVRHDAPAEWLQWTILATFGEYELRTIKKRADASRAERKARGDKMGGAAYGYKLIRENGRIAEVRDDSIDLEPLVRAYREAGTILGACRKLEEWGIPAPRGGTRWATSALTRILEREAPELLPPGTATGRRQRASATFAHLLRCPFCPADEVAVMLTPNKVREQYYCRNGARKRATHPRYAVTEKALLPLIMAEADRFEPPADAVEASESSERRRQAIEDRLQQAMELLLEGDPRMTKDRYKAEQERAKRELSSLGAADAVLGVPALDWSQPAHVVNEILRAMWEYVELGSDMLPVGFAWRKQEWRA